MSRHILSKIGAAALLGGLLLTGCQKAAPADDAAAPSPTVSVTTADATAAPTAVETTAETTTEATAAPTTAAETTAATTTTTTPAATTAPAAVTVNTDGHFVQTGEVEWYLRLVNPWNPLPADYNYEENLRTYVGSQQFDYRAMDALRQMIAAGDEYHLSAASLYRSYELQTSLFDRQVSRMKSQGYSGAAAEEKAATVVARPGTSEHHIGLAVDVLGSGYTSLEQSFDTTPAFQWLKAHCAEYGFIMRYPKEKEDITGVIYEPWHYRYVGVEIATEIMSRGLTLEEYLEEKG